MHGSVTIHMDASPQAVWELVSDVTRIGIYSPETFEAKWTGGSTGPAVGATFKGHVKRNGKGPTYWTPCVVTESVPGQVFAFGVGKAGKPINTWAYRMKAHGGGTDVTESFELAPNIANRIYWALLGWTRGKTNERGMRTTLERIKAEIERTS